MPNYCVPEIELEKQRSTQLDAVDVASVER